VALLKPKEYIARAATARVVYVELFSMATSVLPPVESVEGDDVECYFTITDLAKKLDGRTKSIIQNELRWLVNWRWVTTRRVSWRYLGRRRDGVFWLLADLAARMATGEERLVSRKILGIDVDAPPVTEVHFGRGAARRWCGDTTGVGGGELDLDS